MIGITTNIDRLGVPDLPEWASISARESNWLAKKILNEPNRLFDWTNELHRSKKPRERADTRVCPFPGRTRRCTPTKVMLLL